MSKIKFSITGESVVLFFRDLMLAGNERKAYEEFKLSIPKMNKEQMTNILEGDATLIGINDLIYTIEEDVEYKNRLKEVRNVKKRKEKQEQEQLKQRRENVNKIINGQNNLSYTDGLYSLKYDEPDEFTEHVEFLEEDLYHNTWLISPDGKYYKINYQSHCLWFEKHRKKLEDSDLITYEDDKIFPKLHEQGWIRVSGFASQLVIDININQLSKNRKLLKSFYNFILKFSYKSFTIELADKNEYHKDLNMREVKFLIQKEMLKNE